MKKQGIFLFVTGMILASVAANASEFDEKIGEQGALVLRADTQTGRLELFSLEKAEIQGLNASEDISRVLDTKTAVESTEGGENLGSEFDAETSTEAWIYYSVSPYTYAYSWGCAACGYSYNVPLAYTYWRTNNFRFTYNYATTWNYSWYRYHFFY